ncbi:MAG: tRNA pseudouridine(38-40) synthase TruA [Candidatus Anaerobiospirillum merdipullorum]|uniref:tRNA pseudouridine synthase A n=1 Tax=Candidatus Anaerobiospirillum merdipullorum TaxID=2838450 RepID=A0A9E2NU39_9GAMM|nr:tRNA pseudouridine(38-40) synthase TruA [Candidatus Anaerobiospirillum merdipullorum]
MRIALGIEYAGWNYAGFQRQNTARTVQGELEQALSSIAAQPVSLVCAGRTDAGVNATGQVVHFDVTNDRPDRAWVMGTNTKLPPDIAVTWACHVDESFHARFSARARRYRYILQASQHRPGILQAGVSHYRGEYDVAAMHQAAQILRGEHDFASFCGADDESRSTNRLLHFIEVSRHGPYIVFDIAANAFLNHMVRNIVGSLLMVGSGERTAAWLQEVFVACDRNVAGPTAYPNGLYLVDVTYPASFNLPRREYLGPLWLD